MVATNDTPQGCTTADLITKYTYYLSAIPIVSTLAGVTSTMFAIEGLFLNGYAIYVARKFNEERSNGSARKVFLTSLWYLPCWMVLFLLHSKKWREGVDEDHESLDADLMDVLKKKVDEVRQKGRELCIHEIFVFGTDKDGHLNESMDNKSREQGHISKCPVMLGKKSKEVNIDSAKLESDESR